MISLLSELKGETHKTKDPYTPPTFPIDSFRPCLANLPHTTGRAQALGRVEKSPSRARLAGIVTGTFSRARR